MLLTSTNMTIPATPTPSSDPSSRFAATRWSMVLAAGNWRAGSAAQRAMGELAQLYWFPLYAYLRRRGSTPSQAEDLVQGFFLRLLEKDVLATADRSRGRFRSFLLTALKHYLANEWDRGRAQKRGGGREVLALDAMDAEARYASEPVDEMTPERVFERRWTLAVLEQVLTRLRDDYLSRGQGDLFLALEHLLTGGEAASYRQIADCLGMTEGAAKVAGHRLRRRYRELLREEIAQTVSDPALVDEEIRQLLGNL
jgi:RNA polymerase sigma factor (sigma-70 family)